MSNPADQSEPKRVEPKDSSANDKWLRILFLILFYIIGYCTWFLMVWVSIFQIVFTLISNKPNQYLQEFSHSAATYFSQIINFIAYNSEVKPFPFSLWPSKKS